MAVAENYKVRFDVFEVNLRSGELYKNGAKLKLQPQPLQVLAILLENPGELVTREELLHRVWSSDTFVDFEQGLNTAVKKLRQALSDEAETPHYIETLPRRGYRFIGSIEEDVAKPVLEFPSGTDAVVPAAAHAPTLPIETPLQTKPRRSSKLIWYVVLFLFAAVSGSLLYLAWPTTPYVERTRPLTFTGHQKSPIPPRSVLTDGTRVFFSEHWLDKWYIAQVSASGRGEVSPIETPEIQDPHLFDISRDGSELLVGEWSMSAHPLWIVSLPAGAARRVGDIQALSAKFTPDNKQILFAFEDKRLFIAAKDGTQVRSVLTAQDTPGAISVSPDGRIIRFTTREGVWESAIDGSGLHRFMPELGWTCCGTWTADGELYVFSRFDEKGPMVNLWAIRERSRWLGRSASRPVQLTAGPMPLRNPSSSKDSSHLLVLGQALKAELLVYDEKTGVFGPYLSGISGGGVDFTRDGEWIAYISYPQSELYRCRVDGTGRKQLTYFPVHWPNNPKWSPDGKLIAFESYNQIYLVPASGGNPSLLIGPEGKPMDPTWSSDGKSIVYSDKPSAKGMVRVVNLKTRVPTVLPGSEGLFAPRWAPDGNHILALSSDGKRLMLYSVRNKRWNQLYSSDEIGFPAWSHDSKYIFVSRGITTARSEVDRIRVADGHMEKVADTRSIETTSVNSQLKAWFALTPDDRIIVMRDRGTDEVYALDLAYR